MRLPHPLVRPDLEPSPAEPCGGRNYQDLTRTTVKLARVNTTVIVFQVVIRMLDRCLTRLPRIGG
jgi:hypothetical protein